MLVRCFHLMEVTRRGHLSRLLAGEQMKGCSTRAMTVVATVLSCFVPVPRKMASGLGINEIAAPSLVSAQCPTLGRLPYSDVLELDNLATFSWRNPFRLRRSEIRWNIELN